MEEFKLYGGSKRVLALIGLGATGFDCSVDSDAGNIIIILCF